MFINLDGRKCGHDSTAICFPFVYLLVNFPDGTDDISIHAQQWQKMATLDGDVCIRPLLLTLNLCTASDSKLTA